MTDERFGGYEFSVGEIYGHRNFRVDHKGRLTGVSYQAIWKPGENVASCAMCYQGMGECKCGSSGFWAYHDKGKWTNDGIRGVIRGYGKTDLGTNGFRCEKAEIVGLVIPSIGRTYNPFALWGRLLFGHTPLKEGFLGFVIGMFFLIGGSGVIAASVPWGIGLLILGVLTMGAGFWYDFCDGDDEIKGKKDSESVQTKVMRNYPNVKFFGSERALDAAFKFEEPEVLKAMKAEIDKKNDPANPEFWED
jgi:hypothetical protein